ncbi:transcriptional activator hac1 [Phlyctema vagabunda]|uniref:Transcriptional activator hac1 n=1 Tax=Phlyctema vagabunda TaxID=108571 RepID=A0ABR4P6W4_9HELO
MSSTTPQIKFEHSPVDSIADSFVSTPGTQYPSLFPVDGQEAMTPRSFDDESMFGDSMAGTPAPEKKPVKKRKSWGQQLPEPKTNLPPRKRAKTEDEKEQRRVERVLRNRRAAQSSRERKRQEVEALEAEKRQIERQNQDLQMRLNDMEAKYSFAQAQILELTGGKPITEFRGSSVASTAASSPRSETARHSSPAAAVTLTNPLFTSQDSEKFASVAQQPFAELPHNSPRTIDPTSLSPAMKPVAESSPNASSSDMTQHPAAMLCDLQCQSEEQRPWKKTSAASAQISVMMTLLFMVSTNISATLLPLSQILTSLKTGSSIPTNSSILTLIIWMATTTTNLISTTSSTMTTPTNSHSLRPRFSLRIQLLRRLLSSSPYLARPLKDATLGAMRLAFAQQLPGDCLNNATVCRESSGSMSASFETLMTLHWAIQVIERELQETPTLDAAAVVGQAGELDGLWMAREMNFPRAKGVDTIGQKSLEGWRTEF